MQILANVTSTFSGRTMTLAQLKANSTRKGADRTVNRWTVYKQLCIAKSQFSVNDRCLAVLYSLLSFYPTNEISEKTGLVVFPSNRQISLRAHGMPESTLRRHLSSLIDAGLITRRDSPNGKRYAYKTGKGEVEEAFGFSFAPLLDRAEEIARTAEEIEAAVLLSKRTREQITLHRRDISQIVEIALVEDKSGPWIEILGRFRTIVDAIPRRANQTELELILDQLARLRSEIDNLLKYKDNEQVLSAKHAQNERHLIESKPESLTDSKNINESELNLTSSPVAPPLSSMGSIPLPAGISLDLVLRACPDIRDYALGELSSWNGLIAASHIVSGFLGIAQTIYKEARSIMGLESLSIVIACLLQRADDIKCPAAYLRSLVQKAKEGQLSIQNLLMAGLKPKPAW
ncbi:plasmid replication protein RepC [Brucella cytisi]|uniref:plasmid replication protein RepC n=1 Tax=Brucella cytisi TaxID=407152 RepID=UPI00313CEA02